MAFNLDAMSIYGQDTRMLESLYGEQENLVVPKPIVSPLREEPPKPPRRCFFLDVPVEIRQQVYRYILPRTYQHEIKGVVWIKGCTSVLAVNKQVHDEASPLVYSTNIFTISVVYQRSEFHYQWISPGGLIPRRGLVFPQQLGHSYLKLLRKVSLFVHHHDPYTGMIKYNYSGQGLTDGLRDQVQLLCKSLATIPILHHLQIIMKDQTQNSNVGPRVLEPFLQLKNTRRASVSGDIPTTFKRTLSSYLCARKARISLGDLPVELRQQIYDNLIAGQPIMQPSSKQNLRKYKNTSPRKFLADAMALALTNRANYEDVHLFIFRNVHLVMNVYHDLTYSLQPQGYIKPRHGRHHISKFPRGIYTQGIAHMRRLDIHIAYIPLAVKTPRYEALEKFFELQVSYFKTSPLVWFSIKYHTDLRKSSSGSGAMTISSVAESFRDSLSSLSINDSEPIVNSQDLVATEIATVTASPVTMTASSAISGQILQTPPILYLVSKLNPVLIQVKNRPGGSVSVDRLGINHSSCSSDRESELSTVEDSSTNNRRNHHDSQSNASTLSPNQNWNVGRRALSPAGSRDEPATIRPQRAKRSAKAATMLYADVPL